MIGKESVTKVPLNNGDNCYDLVLAFSEKDLEREGISLDGNLVVKAHCCRCQEQGNWHMNIDPIVIHAEGMNESAIFEPMQDFYNYGSTLLEFPFDRAIQDFVDQVNGMFLKLKH